MGTRETKSGRTRFIGVWIPEYDYNRLSELVRQKKFRNISEAVRFAVKQYLDTSEKQELRARR